MRTIILSLSLFVLILSDLNSAESMPLWPEGATPYEKEKDAETGRPMLFSYLAEDGEIRNGCAVVVCPGGGYGGLAIDHEGHQIAQWLNERGIAAFVLHYRLGSRGHHFPTQLADVQRAIRQVRANAEKWNVDPDRIGVMGFSAGGHLASMAATKFDEKAYEATDKIDQASARPDFTVLCYSVITSDPEVGHRGSWRNLLGPEKAEDEATSKHVSSELNVTENTPPTFLFQTGEDAAVPAENSIRFYLALRQHDIPSEMHVYQRGPHGVGLFHGDPILSTWSMHLENWLRSNGFFADDFERVEVSGEVTLDGKPISWGSVTFFPDDPDLPETTIRIRNGKFGADSEKGPAAAPSRLGFAGSIWEATRSPDDRVVLIDRVSPDASKPITVGVKPGLAPLKFDLKSR